MIVRFRELEKTLLLLKISITQQMCASSVLDLWDKFSLFIVLL